MADGLPLIIPKLRKKIFIGFELYILFNAGRGSVFTKKGIHEMDASLMDGSDLSAGAVCGVRSVRNDILVLPVSQFDDELRYRVSRAIYGNPTFWNYAAMANPPIHIIVEGGHVTLAGVVNSNVERVLARSLATGLGELSVTNALKTDAEIRSE